MVIFTAGKYISVYEFIIWLGITRNTFIETLLAKFKKNHDYFIVNYEDEMRELKITSQSNYKKRLTQKYYLITTNCFKEYCTRSLTNKGNLVRKYYFKLDELFKEFHLEYIEKSDMENKKLLNNQKKMIKKYLVKMEFMCGLIQKRILVNLELVMQIMFMDELINIIVQMLIKFM